MLRYELQSNSTNNFCSVPYGIQLQCRNESAENEAFHELVNYTDRKGMGNSIIMQLLCGFNCIYYNKLSVVKAVMVDIFRK
jgi:hypothetical protein